MKFRALIFATATLATSSLTFAQAPAPGAPATPPAGGAPATPAKPAEKKVPLAANDKKMVKDSTEGMYLVMQLVGDAKTNAQNEKVKTLSEKVKGDFDKIWEDVAGFATNNGETIPSALKGADKSARERLQKGDKKNWDRDFLKIGVREVKKLSHTFTDTKSLQNADLKAIADKWRAVMSGYEGEFETAEKEVSKAK